MKLCKLNLFILFFLLNILNCYSQLNTNNKNIINVDSIQRVRENCIICPEDSANYQVKIIPDYFLLGTFGRYNQRFEYIDKPQQVDKYYPFEEPMVRFLTEYIISNYNIHPDTVFVQSRNCEILSAKLAKKLNKYYDKQGDLVDSFFKTDEEIYSFILGSYYRHGLKISNKIYHISQFDFCLTKYVYPLLIKLSCEKIYYKFYRDYIPSSTHFYFEATPRLIKYFNTLDTQKKELTDSFMTLFYKSEKQRTRHREMRKKEADKVINFFE